MTASRPKQPDDRPDYFAPAPSAEDVVLRRIKGNARRQMISKSILNEGYEGKCHRSRILVVHHERLIGELICKLLEQAGYETRMECSSADAIFAAGQFTPRLLIIDPVMPQISGLDAAKHIFGQTRCKVLLVSAGASESGFEEILRELRGEGCDCAALGLPFEREELLELVRARIGSEIVCPNDTGHRARHPEDVRPKSDSPGSMIDFDNVIPVMPDAELAKQEASLVRRGLGLNDPANRAARKGRILLINDQASLLEVMQQIVVASGYEVRSVCTEADAIETAKMFEPQVAILGLTMPLTLGIELSALGCVSKVVLWGEVDGSEDLERRRDFYDFDLLPLRFDAEKLLRDLSSWVAEAWTMEGGLLAAKGNHLEALQCYEKALAVDSLSVPAWTNQGDSLEELGRWREAIASYDSALHITPDSVVGWMGRGRALHHLGRYDEALLCYDKVLEIDRLTWTASVRAYIYSDAWNSKGTSLYRMSRYQESIECYEKAIDVDPAFAFPWYNKGNSLRELSGLDEAIRCYEEAIVRDPSHAKSWNNKGLCLRKMGKLEEALACHEKAVTCVPLEALGWYNKALVEDDLGRIDDAVGSYEKYLAVAPPGADNNVKHAEERLQTLQAGTTRHGNNDARSNPAEDPHALEIAVIRPANNPLSNGIEYESMTICRECLELHGFWRPKRAMQTPGSKFRVSDYSQECQCEEASSNLNETWPGFDFKKAVELCYCCGAQPILTGSKSSPWFCSDCEAFVLGLNRKYRRFVIPFGRHSLHGGSSLGGQALKDQAEIAYYTQRASELSDDMDKVQRFAKQILSENLQTLGFGREDDVELNAYLATLERKPVTKKNAFLRLCRIFDIEP